MRHRVITALIVMGVLAGVSGWLLAAEFKGTAPDGEYRAHNLASRVLTGPNAETQRRELLRAALPRHVQPDPIMLHSVPVLPTGDPLTDSLPSCRFLAEPPTGTSAKFDCVLSGGEVVKVKYGRNPEIHAEMAATRLLTMLGYPADEVVIVPRIRCYGCPRFPFMTMRLLSRMLATGLLAPNGYDDGYSEFEWVAVERKFPAAPIETETEKGWSWWELALSRAPRAELDALRLVAAFLAHWDNKSENQRLVCMDGPLRSGVSAGGPDAAVSAETAATPASADSTCSRPVLVLQDVGATFGPSKVNLARWRDRPVWADPRSCLISMAAMPFRGATFPDARISEEGRSLAARRLGLLSNDDVRTLFAEARFPEFQSGTNDRQDLEAWTGAFRSRVNQIANAGPCPSAGP